MKAQVPAGRYSEKTGLSWSHQRPKDARGLFLPFYLLPAAGEATLSLQAGNDDFIRNHACWHPDLHTPQPFGPWKASCRGRLVGGRADAGSGHFGDMLGLGSGTRGQELLQRLLLRSTVKPYLTLPDLSAPGASSSAEELHRTTFEILLYSVTPSFCHSLCRTSSQPFSKPQIKTNKWHWKETEKGKGLLFASFKQEDFMPSKPHSAVLH